MRHYPLPQNKIPGKKKCNEKVIENPVGSSDIYSSGLNGTKKRSKKKFLQQNVSRCIFLQAIVELYDLGLKKPNIIISSF